MASENKEALFVQEEPRKCPGEGHPVDCRLRKDHGLGHVATKFVWQTHGDWPSLASSWKDRPHSAQIPALPLDKEHGLGKLLFSSESQSPLL